MKDEILDDKKVIIDQHWNYIIIGNETYYDLPKKLLDYIINLQQENQDIKDTLQDKLDYIGHLKELCDKYEEEHNTTFIKWTNTLDKNKKAIEKLKSIRAFSLRSGKTLFSTLINETIDILNVNDK